MRSFLYFAAIICIALSWLIPVHYRPWITYTGEIFSFISLFALCALFLNRKWDIPKITLPLLVLALVPFIQLIIGNGFFFSKALMSSVFILALWMSVVIGYNLSQTQHLGREKLFVGTSWVFVVCGLITSFIAICQWLTIDAYIPGMVDLKTDRPFANFAQPNNMATFLIMALLGCWYLYEKKQLKTGLLALFGIVLLFSVALSQSRTSWVACCFILIYGAYQSYRGVLNLKFRYTLTWLAVFIGLIVLIPLSTQWLIPADLDVVQTRTVVQRATGDMSRLAIWKQMWAAVLHQPWVGYGWNQTSVAYTVISDHVLGPVWVKSAHNFILDFLIWNGLIIGIPFLSYFAYWGWKLHRLANTPESVVAILMIGAVLIHGMLEFPLFYAFFLLPLGFLVGIVQSENLKTPVIECQALSMRMILGLSILLTAIIARDYEFMVPKMNQSLRHERTGEKITNQTPIFLLSEFNRRTDWIRMSPYQKVEPEQLQEIEEIVLNYPIPYDLLKYAKLLAYNGYEAEAKHQLWRLKVLRKMDVKYEDLLKDAP